MGEGTGAPRRNWIVQGPAVASGALARYIGVDPGVGEVRRIAPDVVVLAMTADRAGRLEKEVAGLIVEADAGLDPFSG